MIARQYYSTKYLITPTISLGPGLTFHVDNSNSMVRRLYSRATRTPGHEAPPSCNVSVLLFRYPQDDTLDSPSSSVTPTNVQRKYLFNFIGSIGVQPAKRDRQRFREVSVVGGWVGGWVGGCRASACWLKPTTRRPCMSTCKSTPAPTDSLLLRLRTQFHERMNQQVIDNFTANGTNKWGRRSYIRFTPWMRFQLIHGGGQASDAQGHHTNNVVRSNGDNGGCDDGNGAGGGAVDTPCDADQRGETHHAHSVGGEERGIPRQQDDALLASAAETYAEILLQSTFTLDPVGVSE